jgi:hypothetical protein
VKPVILLRALRPGAYALLLGGIVALVISVVRNEGVNQSGYVPGVALGFILVVVAGLTLVAANHIHVGRRLRAALVVVLMGWLATSTFLVVWVVIPGSLRDVPMGIIIGLLMIAGFLGTLLAVIYLLVLFPLLTVMAWIADRIPALRRQAIGDKLRNERRPRT